MDDIKPWLKLAACEGVSTATKWRLIKGHGGPAAASEVLVRRSSGRNPGSAGDRICEALAWRDHNSAERSILTPASRWYPPQLLEIADPPLVLFVEGTSTTLGSAQLAVVGSRKATPAGSRLAESFAAALTNAGVTMTSGMALGIDTAAHQGALRVNGPTVAVTGTGADRVYPRANVKLKRRIIAGGGAVVTEFFPSTAPLRHHFPRRNRIISGLALAVLVVEAGPRSGSLITARMALEQNRDVLAVPGSVDNVMSRGCHDLIRQGAMLVETPEQVMDALNIDSQMPLNKLASHRELSVDEPLSEQEKHLLKSMTGGGDSMDEIAERSGLTTAEVCSMLLKLELAGAVAPQGSGRYQRLAGWD